VSPEFIDDVGNKKLRLLGPTAFPTKEDMTLVAAAKNEIVKRLKFWSNATREGSSFCGAAHDPNARRRRRCVQQSLQKAFVHLHNFKGKSSFSTWLTRIAINELSSCCGRVVGCVKC